MMTGDKRREMILQTLRDASKPLSGTALGEQLGVSRQIIVQDIALLRTAGFEINSTNRGYVLHDQARPTRLVKVRHTSEQIEEELNIVVDLGGCVEDVMVNHRTYGRVEAQLGIRTRRDVKRFLAELESGVSEPLLNVTSGYHFHHISAESEEILDEVIAALSEAGFTAALTDFEQAEF